MTHRPADKGAVREALAEIAGGIASPGRKTIKTVCGHWVKWSKTHPTQYDCPRCKDADQAERSLLVAASQGRLL